MSFTIPPIVFTILEGILIVLGAYFVIFWFGLIAWTVQDVRRRTRDWLVRIIAFLLVTIFHIPGLIIYLIVRPQETLAAVDGRAIEEEALLQAMEEKIVCPHCHKAAQPDYAVCPYCSERLKNPCASCGRLLALNWTVCPTCATAVQPAQPQVPVAIESAAVERMEQIAESALPEPAETVSLTEDRNKQLPPSS
jgi:RNA polymerase subunit RPABC4/transcription elongation factor Spt4